MNNLGFYRPINCTISADTKMSVCSDYEEHQFKEDICLNCKKHERDHPPIPAHPFQWSISDVSRWLKHANIRNREFHKVLKGKIR